MITYTPADMRYFENFGWIRVHSLFSFNHHYDPENTRFGSIMVFNDYTVAPGLGFAMHPHENKDQIFCLLRGELTLSDSLKNTVLLRAGGVERIIAGTGYARSSYNYSSEPVRYIGIWMLSAQKGLAPAQDTAQYSPELWQNKLFPLAGWAGPEAVQRLSLSGSGTIYRAEVRGAALRHSVVAEGRALMYILDGSVSLNGTMLRPGDHARVVGPEELCFVSDKGADFLLVDMPV